MIIYDYDDYDNIKTFTTEALAHLLHIFTDCVYLERNRSATDNQENGKFVHASTATTVLGLLFNDYHSHQVISIPYFNCSAKHACQTKM